MEMSSSSASQCRPKALIVTWARSVGVACSRRGNQTSGTPMVRPSLSATQRLSSSKLTFSAEMIMPSPFDVAATVRHDPRNSPQGSGVQATTLRQSHLWVKPEFRAVRSLDDMHMRRLPWVAFVGVEEVPKPVVAEDGWHGGVAKLDQVYMLGTANFFHWGRINTAY